MSKVTVAAVQMTYGLENAMEKVREAASQAATYKAIFVNFVLRPAAPS